VRVFASNIDEIVKLGTVTRGDGDFKITLPYGKAALRTQNPQFGTIVAQYLTDGGVRVEQSGALTTYGPDASGRFTYDSKGLGPSRRIEHFTVQHEPLEEL
jgi:hypothetical protein